MVFYKNKPSAYSIYHQAPHQAKVADAKTLDHQIRTLKPPPAADHPWRQYGRHLSGKPIQHTSPQGSD